MENSWELNMCCSHATCSSAKYGKYVPQQLEPCHTCFVLLLVRTAPCDQIAHWQLSNSNYDIEIVQQDPVHVSFRQNLADKDNGRISFAECMLPVSFCLSLGNRDALTNMLPK